ncbi:MAG: methylglyoxal synthase [Anaerolineales bacterium]
MTPRTIALIAHDGKKADMVAFAKDNAGLLRQYDIIATGTTGRYLQEKSGLKVTRMSSGPLGGDAQIAAHIVDGKVTAMFFFVDPLGKHPHDPDIQMLLRICNVHNVPLATNEATALCIIAAMEIAQMDDAPPRIAELKTELTRLLPPDAEEVHEQ